MARNDSDIILQVKKLSKTFPGTVALDQVDFDIRRQEIHAIIGENGAGKSTLCKILTGLYKQNEGEIIYKGSSVSFKSTREAIANGINMVYQERNLIAHLTGAENIMLGNEAVTGKFFLNAKKNLQKANEMRDRLGLTVNLDTIVGKLSAGMQQSIEIVRSFASNPELIIFDEPTASLSEKEIGPFLKFMNEVRKNIDISIIFISHKLDEVFQVADRITVMVEGRVVATFNKEETTINECIKLMLKNKVPVPLQTKDVPSDAKTLLEVGKCTYDGREHKLDMYVKEGEVVGFYGLVGSGRSEFAKALFGLSNVTNGEIKINDKKVTRFSTSKMIEIGLIMTPEMRSHGMFANDSLIDNITMPFLSKLRGKLGLLDNTKKKIFAERQLAENAVKYAYATQPINKLSGGNIQKIIIGRSIAYESIRLLILDEPTNGLDLGAKNEVYHKARNLAEKDGKGIIFISSELDEVINVCDRIYVFAFGNIVGEFTRDKYDKHEILKTAFIERGIA